MSDFSKHVVDEIASRGARPLPRWHFLLRRSFFWTFAVLSVLSGGVALSVAYYVFFDNEGIRASTLLESPIEDVLQAIPVIWLAAFGLFLASAYVSLRKTRSGYRYRTAIAVAALVAATFALGYVLTQIDFGQSVHYYLLHHTSAYDAVIHSNDDTVLPM